MNSRDDIVTENGLCPLVALLTSDAVEAAAQKNALTFADLLAPFCSAQTSIKDPNGQQISTKLRVDVRNIQQSGFLLSLTVLPNVLHEAVASAHYSKESDDAWSVSFRDSFMYWLEPAECDFLKTYLCCIFAVSADEDDPQAELGRLTQLQHLQQHGTGTSTASFGPAHCAAPKWFLPNIMKYYVVVQDVSLGNDQKAAELYSQLCATHGTQYCHLLKINSTSQSDLPDPWARILEHRYRGLHSGLDLARRHLINKASESDLSNLSLNSPVATHPPANAVFTTSTLAPLPYVTPTTTNGYEKPVLPNGTLPAVASTPAVSASTVAHGQCLDVGDRDRLRSCVEDFIRKAFVPFAERQVQAQNETLTNRRGIGKSFTSVRKWLSAASTSPASSAQANYGPESSELQARRLADLAFLFGMHSFAHQLYQSVKKDFANDQSWLYHAAALEMAALTSFMGAEATSPKRYPQHYMENALNYFLNTCGQPLLALRCATLSSAVLSRMEMFNDAGNQLARLTGHVPELYSAVISEHAGNIYGKARMRRRMALNLVLAGHRYSKAEQMTLAMRCYEKALPEYFEKGWCFAEDHCLNVITKHSEDRRTAVECSAKLLRAHSAQSAELLTTFLTQYVTTTRAVDSLPSQFVLPLVNCRRIRVIRGEHPRVFPPLESSIEASTSQAADEPDAIDWLDIERAAYQALSYDQPFKPLLLLSDETTENTELQQAPPNERFRVQISLRNPLSIPLLLRRLRLSVKQDASKAGISCDSQAIDEVSIPPSSVESESQKEGSANTDVVTLELAVTPPGPADIFVVDRLLFDVVAPGTNDALASYLPLEIPGRRLFATKQQRLKKTYAPDRRLEARVSSAPWPLLDFNFSGNAAQQSHVNAFCNQLYQILLDVQNAGTTEVTGLTMATDRPDLVSLSEKNPNSQSAWRLCEAALSSTNERILCHRVFVPEGISPGQKLSLRLSLRAPPTPLNNFPVSVVFYYVDANGGQRHFHYRLLLSTQTLLSAEAKVIDSSDGLCALQVRNVLSSKDSALAKVELLRLSSLVRSQQGAEVPFVAIKPVHKRPVSIESEQTEMCCLYMTTDDSAALSSVWLSEAAVDIPKWSHLIAASRLASTYDAQDSEGATPQIAHLRVAVLWKATIANAGGTVGTILGETLLTNPFVDASSPGKLLFLPGSQSNWAFALTDEERKEVERHMTRSRSEAKFQIPWSLAQDALLDGEQVGDDASVAVQCRLLCQTEPILHDFSSNRTCKFRARLQATNVDPLRRRCTVLVNVTLHDFLPHASGSSARPTSSLSYSAPLSSGLFANLSVTRRVLPFGSSETFTIAFCTLNSGVYDVASCIEAFAVPDGSDRQTRLSLPSCSVTVKDFIQKQ